ncbi:hypothetical protein GW796_10910 [archaeon]|nr:hypothetical protein [archaeon]
MERNEWNTSYTNRIQEISGMDTNWAMECATSADDSFAEGYEPIHAADEEMSYWDSD